MLDEAESELLAGVADDGGFGFAIAKALAEAGATICVGTWPPALKIFLTLLERGKLDESRKMSDGSLLPFFTRPISAVIFAIVLLTVLMYVPAFNGMVKDAWTRVWGRA